MQNAQLVSHVDTELVSRAEPRALPAPEATSTFKPIPHIELVDMLYIVLQQNQSASSEFLREPDHPRPCGRHTFDWRLPEDWIRRSQSDPAPNALL